MPLKTPDWVKEKVLAIKANNEGWGAPRIYGELAEEAARQGIELPVSESTVSRVLRREWPKVSAEQRRQYLYLSWPESMERGDLPWEASAVALELLRESREEASRVREGAERLVPRPPFDIPPLFWWVAWDRPTTREAVWFWRVTQATPEAPLAVRIALARCLLVGEEEDDVDYVRAAEDALLFEATDVEAVLRFVERRGEESIPPFPTVEEDTTRGETKEG